MLFSLLKECGGLLLMDNEGCTDCRNRCVVKGWNHPSLSLQDTASVNVAYVNVKMATRAQPVSARCLRRAAAQSTTLCAMAEGSASATAATVLRDTSVHDVSCVWAVLTHA